MKKYTIFLVLLGIATINAISTSLPMKAYDISAGADGSLWSLGNLNVTGGHNVYRRAPGANMTTNFTRITGAAGTRIAASPDGGAWIVNNRNRIFHYTNGTWVSVSGSASDIAVGGDGTVWIVGTNRVSGGFGISRWNATRRNWQSVAGGAVRITADFNGVAWIVDNQGKSSSWNNGSWQAFGNSTIKGSGVGSGSNDYLIGSLNVAGGGQVYEAENNDWAPLSDSGKPIGAVAVTSDKNNTLYIATSQRNVFAITN